MTVPPDITVAMWDKFIFIASSGGVGAVTRAPYGTFREVPQARALLEAALREGWAVGRARGVDLPDDAVARALALVLAAHGSRRHPAANALVRRLAQSVRERRLFDEVAVAFHQGEPGFDAVFAPGDARQITLLAPQLDYRANRSLDSRSTGHRNPIQLNTQPQQRCKTSSRTSPVRQALTLAASTRELAATWTRLESFCQPSQLRPHRSEH